MFIRTLAVFCLLAASQCFAGVLWDQQPLDGSTGYINQEFGDDPAFSTYQVHDITVTGGGWNITSITEYFTNNGSAWPGSFDARLNIFALNGPAPLSTDDPTAGLIYPAVNLATIMSTVTLSGLSIYLAPGSYWIGFTPIVDLSVGQQFQLVASTVGNDSGVRNPGNGFADGSDWMTTSVFNADSPDGSITINGDEVASAPEPGTASLFGAGGLLLAGLLKRVRRSPAR
jgi:hypothetical protein